MNNLSGSEQEIYNHIMMLCGPNYYDEPSYKIVSKISKLFGNHRQLAIHEVAFEILTMYDADPARRMVLTQQINKLKYTIE